MDPSSSFAHTPHTNHRKTSKTNSYTTVASIAVALSQGQKYNHMVDMWAFGVLMYLLMYGHYPSLVDKNPDFEPLIQEPFEITESTGVPSTLRYLTLQSYQEPFEITESTGVPSTLRYLTLQS